MSTLVPVTLPTAGQFLRWGISHPALFALWAQEGPAVLQAASFNDRWMVVRVLGDATAPALDELFSQATPRSEPETGAELLKLEDELLAQINRARMPGPLKDRKWLKATVAAMKIGLPMIVPEAAQWVNLLDLIGS